MWSGNDTVRKCADQCTIVARFILNRGFLIFVGVRGEPGNEATEIPRPVD